MCDLYLFWKSADNFFIAHENQHGKASTWI